MLLSPPPPQPRSPPSPPPPGPAPPGLAECLPPELLSQQLLLPQPQASRLYTLLGVASLNAAGFLASVALPNMGRMPDAGRALLLAHIQVSRPPRPPDAPTFLLVQR